MSANYTIDTPHTLFTLPRPIDAKAGKTSCGPSHTLSGSRKRKRAEIVVGTDGEGLTVYDVKAPSLLTSNPIPPQSYLTAAPCCAYRKATPARSAERYTYAALRNELGTHKHQVVCFRETLARSTRDAPPSVAAPLKSSCDVGSIENPIVLVEPVPTKHETVEGFLHTIVLVHEKGNLVGYSADLQSEIWKTIEGELINPDATADKDQVVEYAFMQTAATASKGILKGREDLVMLLDPATHSDRDTLQQTQVVCLVTRSGSQQRERRLTLLAIHPQVSSSFRRSPVQFLVQWQLPAAREDCNAKIPFSFDQTSGMLYELSKGSLAAYRFTALGAQLFSRLEQTESPLSSFVPMPQTMALAASQRRISLFNTRYQSIHATQETTDPDTYTRPNKKRKRTDLESTPHPTKLIDYFPSENLVIGILNNNLIGFQIITPLFLSKKSIKLPSGRLCDSLGLGIPHSHPPTTTPAATPIATASTINILATSDPSLTRLSTHITTLQPMSLSGMVEALKHLLRSFSTPQAALPKTAHFLLTNGTSTSTTTHTTDKDSEEMEESFTAADAAASSSIELAKSLLSPTSLRHRASALKTSITLLGNSFPSSQVARALREGLQRKEILLLIELLRVDLEQGGWMARVLDIYPDSEDDEECEGRGNGEDGAVGVVCRVLNYAIDALGMGAWVGDGVAEGSRVTSPMTEDEAEDVDEDARKGDLLEKEETAQTTLTRLRTDASAVLEVVQDSAFFVGFLAEFLRYSNVAKLKGPNAGDVGKNILPLGVRSAKGITKMRVGAGGEVQKRSKRDVGNMLSKRVGRYAFEMVRL